MATDYDTLNRVLTEALDLEAEMYRTGEEDPLTSIGWVTFDFNSTILGSPYMGGTGWLPDTPDTFEWANGMLDRIAALAARAIAHDLFQLPYTDLPKEAATPYYTYSRSEDLDADGDDLSYGERQVVRTP